MREKHEVSVGPSAAATVAVKSRRFRHRLPIRNAPGYCRYGGSMVGVRRIGGPVAETTRRFTVRSRLASVKCRMARRNRKSQSKGRSRAGSQVTE